MAPWIQPAALAIVLVYVATQWSQERTPWRFALRLLLVALSGLVVEESAIRQYGFYDYSPEWWARLGHVPLLVVLIWPVVIHSARALAHELCVVQRPSYIAALTGLLVLLDASLIEPVAVHAGLWFWTEPGLFQVPPIGIFGWAAFACLVSWWLSHVQSRHWLWDLGVVPFAFVGSHLFLVGSWWGGFRWGNRVVDGEIAAVAFALMSAGLCWFFVVRRIGRRLYRRTLLMRIPAALFFALLLAATWPPSLALFVYFLAFTPPNIVLTLQARPEAHGATGETT